jgi:2-keto-4-pentenoate hydratase/2-oxohepta-3-ene-1,7-dioic acid hydratase in catechol pathway
MRLFTYRDQANQKRLGMLCAKDSSNFVDLCTTDPSIPANLRDLLAIDPELLKAKNALENPKAVIKDLADIRFDTLIDNPSKIVCMGLNYADHAKEGGNARPEYPGFFMRVPSSLASHLAPLIKPKVSDKLDYEAELAFVIGKSGRNLTRENALDCVAGYSIFNDGSIRDYQRKSTQWTIGKNFDQTGSFGPWLVTPDELPKGAHGLQVQSRLNGALMQNGNTKEFLWDVVEMIVLISECMTLEPGDVVITGTPAGVGYARTPPVFMKSGDICEIEIEGIGILRNSIEDQV